jgi:8-oxo-dGTP pyrophosphatase MutT (NUDIX family)
MVSVDRMSRAESLLRELRHYEPFDSVERQHCRDLINLLGKGESGFSRETFDPGHVTASCFIIDPSGQRVLLHRHKRLGRWLQMGGHVETNEPLVEAALREAAEESGLDDIELLPGIIDVDVHRIPAGKGEPEHRHYDVRFLARTHAPEAITLDRSESDALAWFPLQDAAATMNEEASARVIDKIAVIVGRKGPDA